MDRTSVKEHRRPFTTAFVTVTAIVVSLLVISHGTISQADPEDFCARVRNDDRLRAYDPALRPDFMQAFKRFFPTVKGTQSDMALKAQAVFRCMGGKLVACFIGPASPCGKIDRSRDNAAADGFCRAHPQTPDVPHAVTGPATEFTYRCLGGHAETSGVAWTLDERGFAKRRWTPLEAD